MGGGDGAVEVVNGTSAGSSRSAPGMSPVVLLDLLGVPTVTEQNRTLRAALGTS